MFSALLAILLVGQCDPIYGGRPPLSVNVIAPSPQVPVVYMQRYSIRHLGLDFQVNGYRAPGSKLITWDRTDLFNRQSYAAAKSVAVLEIAKAQAPAVTPERTPTAEPGPPPTPTPQTPAAAAPAAPQNFGLEPAKIGVGGNEGNARNHEAKVYVESASAESGNGMMHLTVIGKEADRKAVIDDLKNHPALTPYRDRLNVQGYEFTSWAGDPALGFPSTGKPALLLQAGKSPSDKKGGKVLWRATNYAMGPEGLAEAIRKADPNYRPEIDPGPESPVSPVVNQLYPLLPVLAIGGGLLLIMLPRKEG